MVTTLKEKYKIVNQLNDSIFDIDRIQDYELTVQIGPSQFRVCVIDKNTKRCLIFEDYIVQKQSSLTTLLEIFEELINTHTFLNAAFWNKIRVVIEVPLFTVVPKSYFSEEEADKYLLPIGKITKGNEVRYDYVDVIDAYNVYSMPSQIISFFLSKYGENVIFLHKTTSILFELLTVDHKLGYKNMYVVANNGKMHIGIFEQKNMFFFNVFSYKDEITFVKIVLRIFKTYRMNQNHSHIGLWGDIDTSSEIYRTLTKYINDVTIEKYKTDLIFMEGNGLVENHSYMEVFNSFKLM